MKGTRNHFTPDKKKGPANRMFKAGSAAPKTALQKSALKIKQHKP